MGFKALKMKVGVGPKDDIKLIEAVRGGIGDNFRLWLMQIMDIQHMMLFM